ncbi:hypothetical protein MHH28_25215 [Paenibacillus sp. FSL K6-1217]|uniref:hypothetical protein n=1 Tax=Paenibacillus sp. FSL K6-1217 TaxID=2921466 RepID=UPI003247A205
MNNNQKVRQPAKKKWALGAAIVATISLTAMGTSALASPDHGFFKLFTGGNAGITEGAVTAIHQSTVQAGIVATVEQSIIGGNSALIVVSFAKEDGTLFPKKAVIPALELHGDKDVNYMVEQRVTADGKKIIAMFDVETPASLNGKKLTVKADAIEDNDTRAILVKGPFKNSFTAEESNSSYNIAIDHTLSHQQEQLSIQAGNISAIGVALEGKRVTGPTDQLPEYSPQVSVTTKDGQKTVLYLGSTSTTDRGFEWHYNLDKDGQRVFLDAAEVTSLSVDGHIIPVTK